MNKVTNNINWVEIMDKFAKYEGRIIDFCKENNIKQNQLYNQIKKLKKTQTFHVIDVPNCGSLVLYTGANFASSPNRVLIHCLDPVFVCEKIAYTNFGKIVPIQEAIENTITGLKGIGGLQTRGKYREGFLNRFMHE